MTITSSGCAEMSSSRITSQIASRIAGSPWPEPYCMARRPSVSTRSLQDRTDDIQREIGDVGHAAGERDDLRPVGDREQGADGRGGHAVRPGGVPVDVVIQPGVCLPQPLQQRFVRLGWGSLTHNYKRAICSEPVAADRTALIAISSRRRGRIR